MPSKTPPPILDDYDKACRSFKWAAEWHRLDGLPYKRGLNIAHEAIDRHVIAGDGAKVAVRWLGRRDNPIEVTYEELQRRTNRFANVLEEIGCDDGSRVATLLGRVPDLYVASFGALKAEAVHTPLFCENGSEPIRQMIDLAAIEILVTTPRLFSKKVTQILDRVPTLRKVLLTGEEAIEAAADWGDDRVVSFESLLRQASESLTIPATTPEAPALLHFTGGIGEKAKGVIHVHGAVVSHHASAAFVLDLRSEDTYWCTADPRSAAGFAYGMVAPLTHGVTSIIEGGELDANRCLSVLEANKVNIWYTAPAVLRMMMDSRAENVRDHDLSHLRLLASFGESLEPEVVRWAQAEFGVPVLDTWSQIETGSIMIANYRSQPVRPGSMGRPLPGIEATILERDVGGELVTDASGRAVEVLDPGGVGELAFRAGWASMFRGYLNQEQRYENCFVDGWYRSGDLARRDSDGFYWFVGR